MAKRLNIGVDVDGVLADFTSAARKLMKQMFDGRPDDALVQTTWAFESLGINAQEERRFWNKVDTIPNWWLGHYTLPNTDLLSQLCEKHRVIFITNRKDATVGYPIEEQTKLWLKRNFGVVNTNVIISDNKGPVAIGLKLDYFLDDRPKNVVEVYEAAGGQTKVYLLDTTYNQKCHAVPRVKSFNDLARMVLEWEAQ
jgi:uncharacterized HAD superfamily protein